jgi:hypothetical protein
MLYFMDGYTWPPSRHDFGGRLLIAIILMLIPGVNLLAPVFLLGYWLKLMVSVDEEAPAMPPFDALEDFMRGLFGLFGAALYTVPPALVLSIGWSFLQSGDLTLIYAGWALFVTGALLLAGVMVLLPPAFFDWAATDDFSAFTHLGRQYRRVTANPMAAALYLLNALLFSLPIAIILGIVTAAVALLLGSSVVALALTAGAAVVVLVFAGFGQYVVQARYVQRLRAPVQSSASVEAA